MNSTRQTPHNPVGKVFDEEELRAIGNIAEEHDLMILSDEVVRLPFSSVAWKLQRKR